MAVSIAASMTAAMSPSPLSTPGANPADLLRSDTINSALAKATAGAAKVDSSHYSEASKAKARAASQDFEAVFLKSMFEQMMTGLKGEGPFGGSGATGVWRSFLTDEYSKSFAKAGGIGIADAVYSTLLNQQEAHQ
jgi:Rod binding domain-containing protein